MNKEIPSVEELVNQTAIDAHFIAVTEYGYDQSVPKLRTLINQAITQHTAELQRENERLEADLEQANVNRTFSDPEVQFGIEMQRKKIEDMGAENTTLKTQLTQANEQLVALREAAEGLRPFIEAIQGHEFNGKYPGKAVYGFNGVNLTFDALNKLLATLNTTAEQAEAIEREWREDGAQQMIVRVHTLIQNIILYEMTRETCSVVTQEELDHRVSTVKGIRESIRSIMSEFPELKEGGV